MKNEDEIKRRLVLFGSKRRKRTTFEPQLLKEQIKRNVFVPKLSEERRNTKVFVPQLSKEEEK
jgi:hypothetical protein